MNTSFYTAVRGAMTQQTSIDILANNIANVNTVGYKGKTASFLDLMYYNMHAQENAEEGLKSGTGSVVCRTDTDFQTGSVQYTGGSYDFAIQGTGFFMILDPATSNITYTRAGNFSLSRRQDGFYLADADGRLVLDTQRNPIRYTGEMLSATPGVFDFVHTNGMVSVGENEYIPAEKNGQVYAVTDAKVISGALESSNVDLANEMSKVILSSRAYSYALKMIQTSDEVEQTINGIRG